MVDLHPVTAFFLGHVTGHVRCAQRAFQRHRGLVNVYQTNADGVKERTALPRKMQALNGLTQTLGNFFRHIRRAVLQQDAELITAQTRQGIALAQTRMQQRTNMAQQLIACRMATGVIDQFELVQVEEHQGVPPLLTPQVLQHQIQAVLKLTAVGQSGQSVVGRLPGEIGDVLPLLGHVMQHQHSAAHFTCTENRRAHQRHGDRGAIHALNQLGVVAAVAQLAAQNMVDQL